jgi:hypothetical protein
MPPGARRLGAPLTTPPIGASLLNFSRWSFQAGQHAARLSEPADPLWVFISPVQGHRRALEGWPEGLLLCASEHIGARSVRRLQKSCGRFADRPGKKKSHAAAHLGLKWSMKTHLRRGGNAHSSICRRTGRSQCSKFVGHIRQRAKEKARG